MFPARHRAALISVLIALASASPVALSGLKKKPPEGVTLAGTQWQLDRYNSDDPTEALDRAGRQQQPDPTEARRSAGGDVFGGDPPIGRGLPRRGGDPVGGGYGLPSARDRGGWHTSPGGDPTDIDPTGSRESITLQLGGVRRSIFFEALRKNPDTLTFAEGQQYVTVTADGLETECEAGVKAPFSDSYGDGQRSCGWNGRAWVIETTRGRDFNRTDRYELSKDGKTLKYTTTATGDGMGRVTITRRYQVPPATR
jgi:hypothetical protein